MLLFAMCSHHQPDLELSNVQTQKPIAASRKVSLSDDMFVAPMREHTGHQPPSIVLICIDIASSQGSARIVHQPAEIASAHLSF